MINYDDDGCWLRWWSPVVMDLLIMLALEVVAEGVLLVALPQILNHHQNAHTMVSQHFAWQQQAVPQDSDYKNKL